MVRETDGSIIHEKRKQDILIRVVPLVVVSAAIAFTACGVSVDGDIGCGDDHNVLLRSTITNVIIIIIIANDLITISIQ